MKTEITSLKNDFLTPSEKDEPSQTQEMMKPIQELQQELYAKYDSKIVQNVFQNFSRYALTSLPFREVNRIEVFCHYFDMEKKLLHKLKLEDKAAQRIFNRYVFHAREEVSSKLKENYMGAPLTHEDVELSEENLRKIFDTIPLLLSRYNESICHRALNHFSILSSNTLCGKEALSSLEELCERIDSVFSKEKEIATLLDVMPYDALQQKFDLLQRQIKQLKDPYAKLDLEKELILKCGKVHLLPPLLPQDHIIERASLFNASFDGTKWAESEDEISPLDHSIHKNINNVFFLKSASESESDKNVAVFKAQPSGKAISGAMESLAYDVSLLFGINSGLVPTKQKKLRGMNGSIQIFQDGMSWTELCLKSKEEQKRIISKISMRSFLEAVIPILALGNRDVHMDNFFFVKKKKGDLPTDLKEANEAEFAKPDPLDDDNEEYGIVVFDNEFCFQYSNYILTSYRKEKVPKVKEPEAFTPLDIEENRFSSLPLESLSKKSIDNKKALSEPNFIHKASPKTVEMEEVIVRESLLPIRCAIMALPQGDTVVTGEDRIWLQNLVATWPQSFDDFFSYLNSPPGREKLNQLPYKSLDRYQLKAFNDRLQKLINIVHSKQEFTPRDLLIRLFPMYPAFYSLTEMLYPDYTEFAVGAKTAEYLCKKAVKLGKIKQEKADHFLEEVYRFAEK